MNKLKIITLLCTLLVPSYAIADMCTVVYPQGEKLKSISYFSKEANRLSSAFINVTTVDGYGTKKNYSKDVKCVSNCNVLTTKKGNVKSTIFMFKRDNNEEL